MDEPKKKCWDGNKPREVKQRERYELSGFYGECAHAALTEFFTFEPSKAMKLGHCSKRGFVFEGYNTNMEGISVRYSLTGSKSKVTRTAITLFYDDSANPADLESIRERIQKIVAKESAPVVKRELSTIAEQTPARPLRTFRPSLYHSYNIF